jgi:hypothetical protein
MRRSFGRVAVAQPGNLCWPPASEVRAAEVVGGGVDAPEATEPFDEDGGRSEPASFDSTRGWHRIANIDQDRCVRGPCH